MATGQIKKRLTGMINGASAPSFLIFWDRISNYNGIVCKFATINKISKNTCHNRTNKVKCKNRGSEIIIGGKK